MKQPSSNPASENPRTRRVRELMLTTAVEILLESGAHQVTAARIAEQADVARTTVYRQWPDQRSLLLATIESLTASHQFDPPRGPIDDDIRTALEQLRTRLVIRQVREVFGALAGQAAHDEAFRDAQRLFVTQLTQPLVAVFDAAVERGDIDASTDWEFEATLLASPLLHHYLALHEEISDRLIDAVTERWLAANL